MSTAQPQLAVGERVGEAASAPAITVYGHSALIYWWPVWLVSFILAAATYAEGDVSGGVTVSNTNIPGAIFVVTLLAVAVSSTVLFRGMVSVVAAVTAIAAALAFAWFGWWDEILGFLAPHSERTAP